MPNEKRVPQKNNKAKVIASEQPRSAIQLRSVKVSSTFIPKRQPYLKDSSVPFLRLTGKWLEKAGFPIDCKVDVIVEDNLLIIKPTALNL